MFSSSRTRQPKPQSPGTHIAVSFTSPKPRNPVVLYRVGFNSEHFLVRSGAREWVSGPQLDVSRSLGCAEAFRFGAHVCSGPDRVRLCRTAAGCARALIGRIA